MVNKTRNRKRNFRDVQILDSVSIGALWNDYILHVVTDFAKFYTRIRNVMDSASGVSETINRK